LYRETEETIGSATRWLRCESSADRLRLALHKLELRYSPSQPRVPAGQSEGGQWTRVGGSSRSSGRRRTSQGRIRFSGPLVRQNFDTATGALFCTYYDARNDYRFTVVFYSDNCPYAYIGY